MTQKQIALNNLRDIHGKLIEWETTRYFNQRRQLEVVSKVLAVLLEREIKIVEASEDKDSLIILPEGVKVE